MSKGTESSLCKIKKQKPLQPAPAPNLVNPIKLSPIFSRKAFVSKQTDVSFGKTADLTAETVQRLWSECETFSKHNRILML